MIQYRFNWSASSNITFRGQSEWYDWDGDEDMSVDEVEAALLSDCSCGETLDAVLNECGFEWDFEVREVERDG